MTIVIFFGICYIKWEERWKMGIYIDKFFLFLAGTWLLYNNVVIPVDVAYLLSGVIILFVSFYFDTVKNITAMNIVYISEIIAGLFFPKAICFLPVMIYTITYSVRGIKKHIIYGITYIMLAMKYVFGNYQDSSRHIMFVLVCFISAILAVKEYNIITQKEGIKRLRDDSTEKNNLLAEKNKMLTVTMNNEIRIATLRFRLSRIHNRNTTAMIIHVTTTDSYTGIPPNKGIVNTVSQLSSSISPSTKASICTTSFLNMNHISFLFTDFIPQKK